MPCPEVKRDVEPLWNRLVGGPGSCSTQHQVVPSKIQLSDAKLIETLYIDFDGDESSVKIAVVFFLPFFMSASFWWFSGFCPDTRCFSGPHKKYHTRYLQATRCPRVVKTGGTPRWRLTPTFEELYSSSEDLRSLVQHLLIFAETDFC